jgi:hypothetical protein
MKMRTRALTALKPHRYGTRQLTAGEEYEAPLRQAVALVAGKKAKFADNKKPARAARVEERLVPDSDDSIAGTVTTEEPIDRLRLEATQLGIDVDSRWGVARLQHEIAQAKR